MDKYSEVLFWAQPLSTNHESPMIKLKHDFIYGSIENEAKMIAGLVTSNECIAWNG